MTWRQVEVAMAVDPTLRSSSRVRTSKKTKTTYVTSSSKKKGKRKETKEEEDLNYQIHQNCHQIQTLHNPIRSMKNRFLN